MGKFIHTDVFRLRLWAARVSMRLYCILLCDLEQVMNLSGHPSSIYKGRNNDD